jgi:Rod binding domain-containing protein
MNGPISPVRVAPAPATNADVDPKRAEKLRTAAHEFESLLVKQLLTAAKITGEGKASGYADMAVDALTSGVQKAGGLGLAKRIEEALSPAALQAALPKSR